MEPIASFGYWIRRRRKALDLTQTELARRIGCSAIMLKKVEADERRPSPQLAEALADGLHIFDQERVAFLRAASREQATVHLATPHTPAAVGSHTSFALPVRRIPLPLTPLVGRQVERAAVSALLLRDTVRLVTLTGPGGVGKTRLALEVGLTLNDHFPHGVTFIALAMVREPDLVLPTLAQTLAVPLQEGKRTLAEQLTAYLQSKQTLLLLDNFEHVLAAAPAIAALLAACPQLRILTTSRAVLHLQGEHEYPVAPLALPDAQRPLRAQRLADSDAVELFVQRAQAVQTTFALTDENSASVAAICRQVDGLPLAIELAAQRVKLLPPQALLKRLEKNHGARFDLLQTDAPDRPVRHHTLRQAIGWSYRLLDPAEQALFRRLAVFVGGCTLEAAEAVCHDVPFTSSAADGEARQSDLIYGPSKLGNYVLGGLASLVDKSLVQQSLQFDDEPRFGMLETIREYAGEQHYSVREEVVTQRLHAEHFVQLAEQAAAQLRGPDQANWLERLAVEYGNLRAALAWALANKQTDTGARLGIALWRFWYIRGYYDEGWQWLTKLLALAEHPEQRANLLYGQGMLARRRGDSAVAADCFAASLALFRKLSDVRGIASALRGLGMMYYLQDEREAARPLFEQALGLFRQLDDQEGVAVTLDNLAYISHDEQEEHQLYQESLALRRASGNLHGITLPLAGLAFVAINRGDYTLARTYLREHLRINEEIGNQNGVANSLQILALVAFAEGDFAAAQVLYDKCLKLCQETGDRSLVQAPLLGLGMTALKRGEHDQARGLFEQVLTLSLQEGAPSDIAQVLEYFASLAVTQGQAQRALCLAGAAAKLRDPIHFQYARPHQVEFEQAHTAARRLLSEEAANAAWAAGQAMTLEQAVAYAMAKPAP